VPTKAASKKKAARESTSPISTLVKEVLIKLKINIPLRPRRSLSTPPSIWPTKLEMAKMAISTPTWVIPTPKRMVMQRAKKG
jgi:hypothetical protein